MRKFLLKIGVYALVGLGLGLLLCSVSHAQSNVRPIYDDGVGNTARPVDKTHGLPVQLVNPAAPSTTPLFVNTPPTIRVTAAQTVTAASAYASGNVVGGKITFTSAVRATGQGGVIQSVVLRDKAGQNVSYDLLLFDADPTATTVTDKSAVALNTADLAKAIGTVSLSGAVLGAASTMGVVTASGVGLAFKLTSGTTMYGILVTRGTPTYASTSDVSVDVIVLPD